MSTTSMSFKSFEDMTEQQGITFIDFWAGWCGPCRTFAPIFEAAAERHSDVTWAKVDTEEERELASALGIRSIPTLMVFRDGILVFSQAGLLPADALDQLVEQVRALDMDQVRKETEEAGS